MPYRWGEGNPPNPIALIVLLLVVVELIAR